VLDTPPDIAGECKRGKLFAKIKALITSDFLDDDGTWLRFPRVGDAGQCVLDPEFLLEDSLSLFCPQGADAVGLGGIGQETGIKRVFGSWAVLTARTLVSKTPKSLNSRRPPVPHVIFSKSILWAFSDCGAVRWPTDGRRLTRQSI